MKRFAKQKRKAEKALADSIYRSTFHVGNLCRSRFFKIQTVHIMDA